MKNNWSKKTANNYTKKYKKLGFSKDLALRVYTTRLLGKNLDSAFELAQEVENICHQYINALRIGIPKILSKKEMKIVLGKMKNYKKR